MHDRRALFGTFLAALSVVILGFIARFAFGMDSARAFNLVFAVAVGVALLTASMLVFRGLTQCRWALMGAVAVAVVAATTVYIAAV